MTDARQALRRVGYVTVPFDSLPDTRARRRWGPRNTIFNDATGAGGLRMQKRLRGDALRETRAVVRAALDRAGISTASRRVTSCVLLKSQADCREQRPHYDYDPRDLARLNEDDLPLGVILAIEPETTLTVFAPDRVVIPVPEGTALVFRGDLKHAGSAYAREHQRIHCYVDSRCHRRTPDRTYYAEDVR